MSSLGMTEEDTVVGTLGARLDASCGQLRRSRGREHSQCVQSANRDRGYTGLLFSASHYNQHTG
jgi:hypothetical protein